MKLGEAEKEKQLTGTVLSCRSHFGRLASWRRFSRLAVTRGNVLVGEPCERAKGGSQRSLKALRWLETHIQDNLRQQSILRRDLRLREEAHKYRRCRFLRRSEA